MFAACSLLYPLEDSSGGVDDVHAPSDAAVSADVAAAAPPRDAGEGEPPDAGADADARPEPVCIGPQESETNDEPATADPLPESTTTCGFFDGDPDVFAFEHGGFGTVEIAIDAAESLEVTAVIGGMVFVTHPTGGSIVAPVVEEGRAIVTVRRGNAPLAKRVRYELTRNGP